MQPPEGKVGAEALRHEGPATKKLKKKKPMPPPNMPMAPGMAGMNDSGDEY